MYKDKLKDTPREALNWRLWYGVLVFGLMGAARGLDEGLIGTSSTQPSFINRFGLKDEDLSKHDQAQLLSNITSMVQMGSILGALVGFYFNDRLGRIWATRQLCFLWILGIAIFLAAGSNGSIGMVYAGRFIAGIGIGQTTIAGPTYLAEVAPKAIRGLCVTVFSGSVYLGIMLAYFASWGSSIHIGDDTEAQWIVPNSIHIMFAAVILGLSFFAVESPRWLVKVGKDDVALLNLSKLRGLPGEHPLIQAELTDIKCALEREQEATRGAGPIGIVKELFLDKGNRYRIMMLSLLSQLLSQWSGASSITIYAPEYFAMMGTSGQNEKLFATAILGIVKFVSAIICALFLIDFIGRKRSLLIGITLQLLSMLYMAIFLVSDSNVGEEDVVQSPSQKRAAMGAIVMIYLSGAGWALGFNSIQYLINSEIYPLRLRSIGSSIAMTFHFVNQYGNSKAVPLMFLDMTEGGTMFFFTAVTLLGLLWAIFLLPELSGMSLESIDRVFELPWWQIGLRGRKVAKEQIAYAEAYDRDGKHAMVSSEDVQTVERKA
ncbi:MFS quinate transporter-like protein [Eremomyces bilateralis CBS 781.70]|uniref:MFS quinate transporter-like protein n=1 Tax=Eremomyces bilateralis CBS 781.70 TaxID=1392243 RepID=A0A6G1FSL1_9PEZI|nr:MFS quinate transporter-like protein [Eremomyces bilateralis CBS 781.70]KAF1808671.1 MFS quinate transporter-like protein [Eremomyces bilateralis CBS 781.70]